MHARDLRRRPAYRTSVGVLELRFSPEAILGVVREVALPWQLWGSLKLTAARSLRAEAGRTHSRVLDRRGRAMLHVHRQLPRTAAVEAPFVRTCSAFWPVSRSRVRMRCSERGAASTAQLAAAAASRACCHRIGANERCASTALRHHAIRCRAAHRKTTTREWTARELQQTTHAPHGRSTRP